MSSKNVYLDYITLINDIGDELKENEFKRLLIFMSDKIPRGKTEKNITGLVDVVEYLNERGDIKFPNNESGEIGESKYLIEVLTRLKKKNLADKITNFYLTNKKSEENPVLATSTTIDSQSNSINSFSLNSQISSISLSSSEANYDNVEEENNSQAKKILNSTLSNNDLFEDFNFNDSNMPKILFPPNVTEDCVIEKKRFNSKDVEINSLTGVEWQLGATQLKMSEIIQNLDDDKEFDPNDYSNEKTFLTPDQIEALNFNYELRMYQIELANLSLHGHNSVVCLRTGGGKTLIAAIIVKYLHIKHKYYLKQPIKTIFLVPTRLLIEQQLRYFKRIFGDDICNFMLKGLEDDEQVEDHIQYSDIVFCTPQKLVNSLKKKKYCLGKVDLVVFDECHHAIKNHPYNDIMKFYHKMNIEPTTKNLKRPQIVGLTASIGSGDSKKPFDHLIHLCANLNCIHLAFVQKFKQELIDSVPSTHLYKRHTFPKPKLDSFALSLIELMKRIEKSATIVIGQPYGSIRYMQKNIEANKEYQQEGAREKVIGTEYLHYFNLVLLDYEDIAFEHVFENLNNFMKSKKLKNPINFEKSIHDSFEKNFLEIFTEPRENLLKNNLINDYNPKLTRLIDIIVNHVSSNTNAMGLVFVPKRSNAIAIQDFIKNHYLTKDRIKSTYLMGKAKNTNATNSADENISDSKQKEILENFKRGEFNLLVVTSVAAEGVDLPDCNYVIRYDFVSDEIGFIQCRGRARSEKSSYHVVTYNDSILLNNEDRNEVLEKEMEEALKERSRMTATKFKDLVEEKQKNIINELLKEDTKEITRKSDNKTYDIFCTKCNELLCDTSSLRKRGIHFITIDESFVDNKICCNPCEVKEFKTDKHIAKIVCKNATCGNELGTQLEFLTGTIKYGFTLLIKSIKFKETNPVTNTSYILFKKWKDITFNIEELEI